MRAHSPIILPALLALAPACAPSHPAAPAPPITTASEDVLILQHEGKVGYVCFSPDGKSLVSANWDGRGVIRMWDVMKGATKFTIQTPEGHSRAAFSPDGRLLASAGPNKSMSISLWDALTGKETRSIPCEDGAWSLCFSPDSKSLFAGFAGHIRSWEVETGHDLKLIKTHGYLTDLAFSRDGQWLAAASCTSPIRLIHVETGVEKIWLTEGCSDALAISPDGNTLTSSSRTNSRSIVLWNADTGKAVITIKAHNRNARRAQFSPDGKWLATVLVQRP